MIKYLTSTKLITVAYGASTPDEFRYFGGINFSDVWVGFDDFHITGTVVQDFAILLVADQYMSMTKYAEKEKPCNGVAGANPKGQFNL